MPLTKQKALQYLQESLQSPDIDFREDQWESIDAVVNQNQKVLVAIVTPFRFRQCIKWQIY